MSPVLCHFSRQPSKGWGVCDGPVDQYLITMRNDTEVDRVEVCRGHGETVIPKLNGAARLSVVRPTYRLVPIATRCAYGDCQDDRKPASTLCTKHDD